MPTSRSPKRNPDPRAAASARQPRRLVWLFVAVVVIAVVAVALMALPASLLGRLLPPPIHAEDFSGSLWHGSAGRLTLNSREIGAIEWRLHPAALLSMSLAADLHWVNLGYVIDASARVDKSGAVFRDIHGGGPIEDLAEFGFAVGWHGVSTLNLPHLDTVYGGAVPAGAARAGAAQAAGAVTVTALAGDVAVSHLTSSSVAAGADLGSYTLHFAQAPLDANGDIAATLNDDGGPLEVHADIQYSAAGRSGSLSGTVKERTVATPALRAQLDQLAQLHSRDAQGRLPVDLEFTL